MSELDNSILDNQLFDRNINVEKQFLITTDKFILLSILTLGMYPFWWTYKAWRFFKQKDELDIYPFARALFTIFYLYSLFEMIQAYADSTNYSKRYSSGGNFAGIIIFNFLNRAPLPFNLISLLSFIFYLSPFIALNYAKENSGNIEYEYYQFFSGRQIVIMILGLIFWYFVMLLVLGYKFDF